MFSSLFVLSAVLFSALAPAVSALPSCEAFGASIDIPNVKVLNASRVTANESFTTGSDVTCGEPVASAAVSVCRIVMNATTSNSSSVHLEVWLPDTWYGRTASVGNGGLNGCIDFTNLGYLTSLSFATVGSNNGHDGQTGAPFLNHPEVIKDFAYRAINVETAIVKTVTAAYYAKPVSWSYYVGCSTGGRQGFRAVQDFPEVFDGVLAGSPAFDFNHLIDWSAYLTVAIGAPHGNTSASFIPTSLFDVIAAEAVRQCDLIDGVENGIIDDPDRCDFRAVDLLCDASTTNTSACLTQAQVEAITKIFTPLHNATGDLIYPRLDPGSLPNQLLLGGDFFSFSLDWYRYVILNDTSFDGSTFGEDLITLTDKINPAGISTWKTDLSSFRETGGKVMTYHGRQDSLIASGNSIRYYNSVATTMQNRTLDDFYRFFPIPGMDHCGNGPGAWAIGQGSGTVTGGFLPGGANDSAHNAVLSLVEWVEAGKAPETIIGTKFVNDTPALGIESQRTLCHYPMTSVLKEGADPSEAASWECV